VKLPKKNNFSKFNYFSDTGKKQYHCRSQAEERFYIKNKEFVPNNVIYLALNSDEQESFLQDYKESLDKDKFIKDYVAKNDTSPSQSQIPPIRDTFLAMMQDETEIQMPDCEALQNSPLPHDLFDDMNIQIVNSNFGSEVQNVNESAEELQTIQLNSTFYSQLPENVLQNITSILPSSWQTNAFENSAQYFINSNPKVSISDL